MFWRRKRSFDDFAAEIQSHITLEADQLRSSGEAGTGAEAKARRIFGNLTSVQEAFYERSRWLFWDHLSRDLRHSLRLIRSTPGFSAVVILTLALGIGANTAIFSLINAVLLRPLPYKDPGRLAMLWIDDPAHNDHEGRVSLLDFEDWKQQSQTFSDMTLFQGQTFLLGSDGPPERLRSARVPANFFSLLGVEPALGRVFSIEEENHGEHVVVLSYGLWQRRFAGSAAVIGSNIRMDGRLSRIVGVMPRQFQFPFADTQVWEPLTTHPYWASRDKPSPRNAGQWYVLSRLKPSVTWSQAQDEMNTIAHRLQAAYPNGEIQAGINVVPLSFQTAGKVQRPLAVLFGAVFIMLLIACINVASLLLARGSIREREFAVRRALGANRGRVAWQLFTESLVLAAAGGLLGLLLAAIGLKALIAFGPQDIPRLSEARLDPQVLFFTLFVSLFAALASSLWPALQTDAPLARSRQWISVANRSIRSVLVIGEFSLALVLLTGAGLLAHSFLRLERVDPGFRPEHLLIMRIDLHVAKTAAQQVAYFQEAIERVQRLPGIRSAAAIGRFLKSYGAEAVAIEGRPLAPAGNGFEAADDVITGPYFQTAGIPLRKGRFFSSQDRSTSTPVAIINEVMARSYWPGENPIGKRFNFPERKAHPWFTVVGVVGDTHRQGLEKQVAPQVFRPHSQSPDNEMDILVRTASDPLMVAAAVRQEIQSVDTTVAKSRATTVEQQLGEQTAERRFHTSLIGLFSLIALFLSAIGIYGLIQHFVVQRTHEIGVRMALGARYTNVLALVLRQGLTLAAIGRVGRHAGCIGSLANAWQPAVCSHPN
ncbi:MAG TPA: ABC transporter permease [Bryobacteraceae bacterium]|nr:ABC transporter permease [Bryobacteraceae bacterium]